MTVFDVAPRLPGIQELRDHCRSLAMLDAILSPEWEYREYSFDAHWAPGQEMASWRNGSGDDYAIVFTSDGAYLRGYSQGCGLGADTPGMTDGVPEVFAPQLAEVAFTFDEEKLITVCMWRTWDDVAWRHGAVELGGADDGADWLFELLVDRSPQAYQSFAENYYEQDVPLAAIEHVYALEPLTEEIVRVLNPSARPLGDVVAIGYPGA